MLFFFFFSSRRRHTRFSRDWSSDVCSSDLAKCASGEGHRLSVLTVSYPGGRTRQLSLRSEMVPLVRRWLANYQRLKAAIEGICEINQDLLRPDESGSTPRRKRRD